MPLTRRTPQLTMKLSAPAKNARARSPGRLETLPQHSSAGSMMATSTSRVLRLMFRGDAEAALKAAGLFDEHALRAVEHVRTGKTPSEIKSVSAIIKTIENDGKLPESLRVLVPRIASAVLFDVRSKRGAAHVKEISPRYIDAALAVQAASWIMAEFVRLYHVADEAAVAEAMAALMAGNIPLIEKFGDEMIVTTPLHPETEVLLMVSAAEPTGIDR